MLKNNVSKLLNALMLLTVAAVAALSLHRGFFGVELSDEAYSVGDLYLVAKGGIPFVNNWSQMPGYAVLLAPFIKAFVAFSAGTDGIVLFYRFLVKSRLLCKMLYNVFTISTYQN